MLNMVIGSQYSIGTHTHDSLLKKLALKNKKNVLKKYD